MNILHVNNTDLPGRRFNGHDMQIALNAKGITANQFVMDKRGDNPHTLLLSHYREPFLRRRIMECEDELSLRAMLYPYLFRLMETTEFKEADVVHYHLLGNEFTSLPVLPEITRRKPSVLTLHDPWFFTGRCVYPRECERWKKGCGECPDLNNPYPMKSDNTAMQWRLKQDILSKSLLDIVVASKYMLDIVQQSPITAGMKHVHLIPFGIDVGLFATERNKSAIRRRLTIPEDNFVLFFRSTPYPHKGLACIKRMLDKLELKQPISIVGVGDKDELLCFREKYQVLDFGWVTDDNLMADLYCACDVFLMPSVAEAFGLMAIEAMASGRPIIVCEGTSLPEVTFAPECGIVIPQNDSDALEQAVLRLMRNPEERKKRGAIGRELAEKHYRFEDYVDRHLKLYEEILRRGA